MDIKEVLRLLILQQIQGLKKNYNK